MGNITVYYGTIKGPELKTQTITNSFTLSSGASQELSFIFSNISTVQGINSIVKNTTASIYYDKASISGNTVTIIIINKGSSSVSSSITVTAAGV